MLERIMLILATIALFIGIVGSAIGSFFSIIFLGLFVVLPDKAKNVWARLQIFVQKFTPILLGLGF